MLKKSIYLLSKSLMFIASIAFIVNISVLLYGIVARYVIGNSPIWMDELSRYLIIGTVLLTLAPAWLYNKHMRVDFIESILPLPLIKILRLYAWFLMLFLSGYMAFISLNYSLSVSMFTTMGLGVSKTIPLLTMPIGFACLFITVLLNGFTFKKNIENH